MKNLDVLFCPAELFYEKDLTMHLAYLGGGGFTSKNTSVSTLFIEMVKRLAKELNSKSNVLM
jgi:hypothetical protein